MKNKKRGVSLLEITIVVAMMAVLVSIMGPVIRYYANLGQKATFGISQKAELDGTYQKIQEAIAGVTLSDKWAVLGSATKNAGIGVDVNFNIYSPTEYLGVRLDSMKGTIMNQTKPKRKGNTLYAMVPVLDNTNKILKESYISFRFLTVDGVTRLYYSNSFNADGSLSTVNGTANIPFQNEGILLPTGVAIKQLVTNEPGFFDHNFFQEVGGGVIMHVEYYDDYPTNSSITTVEQLFLKRGEI